MRTLAEIAALVADVGRLLRDRWWLLGFWYCLGWAAHALCLYGSALLARDHSVLANLVFVVGIVLRLAALVLMVHSLEPALRFPRRGGTSGRTTLNIPDGVFEHESPLQAAALALGPFLAVYTVWGFVSDEVRQLFFSNYVVLGLDPDQWSINLNRSRLPFYLSLAVAGWVVGQLLDLVRRRWPRRLFELLGILAEGLWTFATFVVGFIVVGLVAAWLRTRVVTVGVLAGWREFLAALPDWRLLFGQTLSDVASYLVTVLPGALSTVILLPLMWLALTATVFGWREFTARDVLAGTRWESRVRDVGTAEDRSFVRSIPTRLALLATDDLRTKYLPVAQAFRLILRAGPRLVGGYLLLATVIGLADNLATIGLTELIGPQSQAVTLLLDPLQQLAVGLVITSASVALYAAGFDRALNAVTAAPPASGQSVGDPVATDADRSTERPDAATAGTSPGPPPRPAPRS